MWSLFYVGYVVTTTTTGGGTVITMYVEPRIVILPLSMWVCVVNKFLFNRRKILKKSCMTPIERKLGGQLLCRACVPILSQIGP